MTEQECINARAQVMALPKLKRELLTSSDTKYVVMQTYPYHHFMHDSDGCNIFSTFDHYEAVEYCKHLEDCNIFCNYAVFALEKCYG